MHFFQVLPLRPSRTALLLIAPFSIGLIQFKHIAVAARRIGQDFPPIAIGVDHIERIGAMLFDRACNFPDPIGVLLCTGYAVGSINVVRILEIETEMAIDASRGYTTGFDTCDGRSTVKSQHQRTRTCLTDLKAEKLGIELPGHIDVVAFHSPMRQKSWSKMGQFCRRVICI